MTGLIGRPYGRWQTFEWIMYFSSLACIRVKVGESKCFRIESGVIEHCVMFP